jgi:branched-chain amino acid transport system ATP-binding protein
VPRGGLTVLLGRNGAGKTTTLRTIMGLWHASRGALLFDGATSPGRRRRTFLRRHRLRAREHGHLLRPDGARKPAARGARRRKMDAARLEWIFGFFRR